MMEQKYKRLSPKFLIVNAPYNKHAWKRIKNPEQTSTGMKNGIVSGAKPIFVNKRRTVTREAAATLLVVIIELSNTMDSYN